MTRLAWLLPPLAVTAALVSAGCGAGPTTLGVTLTAAPGQTSQIAPGETASFVVTVTDTGPSGTSGVTVSADLPADFRYKDTHSLSGGTGVRTKPVDAQGNSAQPQWGVWELAGHGDTIQIQFDAVAGGQPGTYSMTASASGSSTQTTVSEGLSVILLAAPQLSASVSVAPNQAVAGQDVTYEVSVINQGTGAATAVDVLVTLPPVFAYDGGEEILGDSSRSNGTNPVQGTTLAYFDGFNIPPHNGATPGELSIRFRASVLPNAGAVGTYPVAVQVLADSGRYRVNLPAAAPVQVG
ncbi:MAG TPA: hypothetical protein VEK76_10635 [Candidatus Binatia bacterium]|nr:hypothetical protein [Candidatus Binatia bacterium]